MAHGHTTFAGLFNNASRNTFLVGGTYDAFLAPFNITPGDGNPAPIAVRQIITASANQHLPIALLILVGGRLMPLFLLFKQERAMGVAEHAATDPKMFAFKGEMVGTQGYLIKLQDETFNLTPRTMVTDVGTVCGLLTANLQAAAVGPFNDGNANMATVRTRCIVPLPHKYVSLFLANAGGIPPQYYFETILPVIKADGMAATCEPLTRFCLAVITTPGQGQVLAVQIAALLPPSHHAPLLEQAEKFLALHLMGLRHIPAPEVNLQPLINTIIAGQQQHQQEQAVAHLDREIKDNTLVATQLGVEKFSRLLQYCGVNKE
jgi:hypothetical protein